MNVTNNVKTVKIKLITVELVEVTIDKIIPLLVIVKRDILIMVEFLNIV